MTLEEDQERKRLFDEEQRLEAEKTAFEKAREEVDQDISGHNVALWSLVVSIGVAVAWATAWLLFHR